MMLICHPVVKKDFNVYTPYQKTGTIYRKYQINLIRPLLHSLQDVHYN